MIRHILRRLSRGIVLTRHLSEDFGHVPFLVTPESALSYWRRDVSKVDAFLLSMVLELTTKDATVWDIGANVGLFAFAAAARGAKLVAVEADTWLAHLLQRSVRLNGLPVTVLPAAVSDQCGIATLHFSEDGRASSSLVGTGLGQTVVSVTLDWMLKHFPTPQVLKIDVEAMEYAVLQGGVRLLEKHHPTIFCEVTANHDKIGQMLRALGYALYAARDRERQPLERPSRDTLAVYRPK